MFWSPFRRFASKPIRTRRARSLRQRWRSGLTGWETLGLGMGEALCGSESLESRAMMAADLAVSISDGYVWYAPGTEITYRVHLENKGDTTATDAVLSTSLNAKISGITWTATYPSTGATGQVSGPGNLSDAKFTLDAGKAIDFEIVGTIASDATGSLGSTVSVSLDGKTATDTDTNKLAPKSIVVTEAAGWTSTDLVRVIDPTTDTVRASFHAYGDISLRGGMQAVVVDMDNDGRDEIVTAPGWGRVGEIRVFKSQNDAGTEYAEDDSYRTKPFGDGWKGGLTIAAGDFNGDGRVDIAAAKATGDGEIRIFNGQLKVQAGDDPIANSYRTIRPFGARFLGGASLAAADLGTFSGGTVVNAGKQDGRAELIVGSGPTVAPIVRIYDMSAASPVVVDTIRPFSASFVGGVSVAAARMNADGIPDLIVSSGWRGKSATEIYDGRVGVEANPRLKQYEAFAAIGRLSSAGSYAQALDRDGDGRLDTVYSVQGAGGTGSLTKLTLTDTGVTSSEVAGVSGALTVAATGVRANPAIVTTASGLKYRDIEDGNGDRRVAIGSVAKVLYTGYRPDGSVFDSSYNRVPVAPLTVNRLGAVTGVGVDSGGSGYTSATVTFEAPPAGPGSRQAKGTVTIAGGKVTGITITDAGAGYVMAPKVTISGPNSSSGTRAVLATPSIDGYVAGWSEGLMGMKQGGRRQLIVPANLGYGAMGNNGAGIDPNSMIIFDVILDSLT